MKISHILIPSVLICVLAIFGCGDGKNVQPESEPHRTTTCSNCPKIKAGQDTLEFVNEVRHFVAKNANEGLMFNALCDTFDRIELNEFPVDAYLEIFEKNQGVTSSGLSANLMTKMLLENGIDAYIYSFGFEDSRPAHASVLVKNQGRLLVFDPYLNYELLDENGNNLDLLTLIDQVGNSALTATTSNARVEVDVLADEKLLQGEHRKIFYSDNCKNLLATRTELPDSIFLMKMDRCYACDAENECLSFVTRMVKELRKATDFTEFHEAYVMKTYDVEGADDFQEIDDLIQTRIYSQPNLGKRINGKLEN